jgi:hypothetical protein
MIDSCNKRVHNQQEVKLKKRVISVAIPVVHFRSKSYKNTTIT